MYKLTLILLTQFVLRSECLLDEGSCADDGGTCILLAQCQPLMTEVNQAGKPMPEHIRIKLQKLTCGFSGKYPMVCCVQSNGPVEVPNRGGGPMHTPNTGDEIDDTYTRRYDDDIGGPRDVSRHPNLPLLPTVCGNIDTDKIFGGQETRLFEMPWMVLLSYDSPRGIKLSCGGTLINEWYVLTAAHCVKYLGSKLTLTGVLLGEHNVNTDPDCEIVEGTETCASNVKTVGIDKVTAHSGYTTSKLIDDIALIRLSEKADFGSDNVAPICLPTTAVLQRELLVDKNGVAAGWGLTEEGPQAPILRSVDLPIINKTACQAIFKESTRIHDEQICAGGIKGKDSCGGDSGGPLMYPGVVGSRGAQYVQRGIVSFGAKRCGIGGLPGVYTNVAYFMEWILDNIHS